MSEQFNERAALAEIRGFLEGAPLPPVNYRDLRPEATEAERLEAIEQLRLATLNLRQLRREQAESYQQMRAAEESISDLHGCMNALEELQ